MNDLTEGAIAAIFPPPKALYQRRMLRRRLAVGLRRLRGKRQFDESMQKMADSIMQVTITIRDHFTPALEELQFTLQRFHVTWLNSEPWYRHWRARWALRKARKWARPDALREAVQGLNRRVK